MVSPRNEAENNVNPILSIGIPTYNRAHLLKDLLISLEEVIADVNEHIEIVISDNGSTDDTESVCREFARRFSGRLLYSRNETNIGISKNIISMFDKGCGKFVLWMGDDDKLSKQGLQRLLDTLQRLNPSAVIQANGVEPGTTITLEKAIQGFFYEYGNAYKACVDRGAARAAMERRKLRATLEQMVWPHTVIGFLAMRDLDSTRPICLTPDIGSSDLHETLNIKNFTYHRRSFIDLIKAAAIVDPNLSSPIAIRSVVSLTNRFFVGHVMAMCTSVLTEDVSLEERRQVARDLAAHAGVRGRFFSALCTILFNRPVSFVALTVFRFLRGRGGVVNTIRFLKSTLKRKQSAATLPPGVRYLNYFD